MRPLDEVRRAVHREAARRRTRRRGLVGGLAACVLAALVGVASFEPVERDAAEVEARIVDGASGLRSQRSMCDGPPGRKMLISALRERPARPAPSSRARSCGRDRPPRAMPPILRKLRRAIPSQCVRRPS